MFPILEYREFTMNYYFDIKTLPDSEMRPNELLNKVYSKLHKRLSDMAAKDIGVSFPELNVLLGKTIRLHSDKDSLTHFISENWLGGLAGYCDVRDIQEVPAECQYRTVSRRNDKMSNSQMQRLIKRGSLKEEDVKRYKSKMLHSQMTDLPYVEIDSSSNGHKYRRYIEHGELGDSEQTGLFDAFGLSRIATIPWF